MRVMPVTIRSRAGAGLNCNRFEAEALKIRKVSLADLRNIW